MNVNRNLNDIAKGLWGMTIEGLSFYGPMARKIIAGEEINFPANTAAIMNVYDDKGRRVQPNDNGSYEAPPGSVAWIDVIGVLMKYGGWCSYGSEEIADALAAADNNPNIIGSVAYFDGPGGAVSSIGPLVNFGLTRKKPVVGLFDQCCSALAYGMFSFCDYVMAENNISAMIGSFGVVFSMTDNRKYLKDLGIEIIDVYPDESSSKNEPFRLLLEGKPEMIKQEMLSPLAIKFQNQVKAARPNLKLDEPGVLTGKVFYTDHAIDINLIDSKGNKSQAIEMVRILSEQNSLYKNKK
jgi:protease-4